MGGSWIVKLPSARFAAVPENEFAMLELARRVGIAVPENRLVDVAEIKGLPEEARAPGGKALAVQRFDRVARTASPFTWRISRKSSGSFPTTSTSTAATPISPPCCGRKPARRPTYEFVRRLVFSVLIGNADMHLKNWSLLYPDRRTPVLSPAYDFVATLPYIPDDKLALSFGDSRSLAEITAAPDAAFCRYGAHSASPLWQIAVETAESTVAEWKGLEQADLLPKDMRALSRNRFLQSPPRSSDGKACDADDVRQ